MDAKCMEFQAETGGRNQDSNIAINVSFQVNKSTEKERVLVS